MRTSVVGPRTSWLFRPWRASYASCSTSASTALGTCSSTAAPLATAGLHVPTCRRPCPSCCPCCRLCHPSGSPDLLLRLWPVLLHNFCLCDPLRRTNSIFDRRPCPSSRRRCCPLPLGGSSSQRCSFRPCQPLILELALDQGVQLPHDCRGPIARGHRCQQVGVQADLRLASTLIFCLGDHIHLWS